MRLGKAGCRVGTSAAPARLQNNRFRPWVSTVAESGGGQDGGRRLVLQPAGG